MLAMTLTGWHLFVKVHGHQWVALTGNDNWSSASRCLVSRAFPLTVCDPCYTLMTVHPAVLAPDPGCVTDVLDRLQVFMDEGVFVLLKRYPPAPHHVIAVAVSATWPLGVHVLSLEPFKPALPLIPVLPANEGT